MAQRGWLDDLFIRDIWKQSRWRGGDIIFDFITKARLSQIPTNNLFWPSHDLEIKTSLGSMQYLNKIYLLHAKKKKNVTRYGDDEAWISKLVPGCSSVAAERLKHHTVFFTALYWLVSSLAHSWTDFLFYFFLRTVTWTVVTAAAEWVKEAQTPLKVCWPHSRFKISTTMTDSLSHSCWLYQCLFVQLTVQCVLIRKADFESSLFNPYLHLLFGWDL